MGLKRNGHTNVCKHCVSFHLINTDCMWLGDKNEIYKTSQVSNCIMLYLFAGNYKHENYITLDSSTEQQGYN